MGTFVAFVEISAADFERAVAFYNAVFKLNMETFSGEQEKMAFFPNEEGAISFAPDFKPSNNGTLASLQAQDDIDFTLERVVENGGTVVIPKTKIESDSKGYFAVFIDSEGNKVGLYANA